MAQILPTVDARCKISGMGETFRLRFSNGHEADAATITADGTLSETLQHLQLKEPTATLVIVGGAAGLSSDYLERLQRLFTDVVCPIAQTLKLCVIDGGTDVGVMQLVGQARSKTAATFPLVGVVVKAKAILPDGIVLSDDAAALEPNHTHFLLVPGQAWGDEASWIAQVAENLTGDLPSATLLINGGNIALNQDVPNSIHSQRPVLVVAGSGRAADRLATALRQGTDSPEIHNLIDSGLIQAIDLETDGTGLEQVLTQMLTR